MVWQDYPDLRELAGDREPNWWDEEGVPRFAPFRPELLNNIYAKEVALLSISCAACPKVFLAARSWGISQGLLHNYPRFTEVLRGNGYLSYGDPPFHSTSDCAAGYCMQSDTRGIVQFWAKKQGEWERDSSFEGLDAR